MLTIAPNIVDAIKKFKQEQEHLKALPVRLELADNIGDKQTFDIKFETNKPTSTDNTFEQNGVTFFIAAPVLNFLRNRRLEFNNGQFVSTTQESIRENQET